ncbi:hypothetical protein MHB71_13145 [Paenibacillus sp. FSL H7-0940]|uniref:hypothetical protein n=1 Tax=Paenibacillus sp. FSL H7-0940 TaxID=2921443 RepID=UPI0030EE6F71
MSLSSYDNHPADAGTETFERSRDLAIDDTLTDEFNQVNDALERMEQGTYGTCVTCGEDIPSNDLRLSPTPLTVLTTHLIGRSATIGPLKKK